MIQGLIRKLAEEVNSADAEKLKRSRGREAMAEEAADRSVGALRQAARNMKEPLQGASADQRGENPDVQTEIGGMKSGTAQPPPLRPMTAPASDAGSAVGAHQGDPYAAAPDSSGRSGADLDVEALMRRAQPIASMTSVPPPLPQAFNAMAPGETPAETAATSPQAALTEQGDASAVAAGDRAATGEAAEESLDDLWDLTEADAAAVPADHIQSRLARIADAIEAGRVDVFLEPILDLEKHQAQHYEVSVSLRDQYGMEIVAEDAAEAEQPTGALPLLDSLRLKRTAQVARRLEERNKSGNVFSTFSDQSLTSDNFLSTFADTYDAQVQIAGQLVLTFSQSDARKFGAPHWTMINEMRDLGFGFAVRAVTDLDMDFEMLASAGFKYVKLDADVFLAGLPVAGGSVPAADLCKHFAELGMTPIVEAIDDGDKRQQVFAYGVRLGQGQLFGGARQVKTSASGQRSAAA